MILLCVALTRQGKVERPTPVKLHQQREALEQDSRLPRFWTATETLLTVSR